MEKRILRNHDFVEMYARMIFYEANRLRIGDEVDVMSAVSEFNAEFCRNDSAAAVRGITGNAYFQAIRHMPFDGMDPAEIQILRDLGPYSNAIFVALADPLVIYD